MLFMFCMLVVSPLQTRSRGLIAIPVKCSGGGVAQLLVHNALSDTQSDQMVGLVNSASQLHCPASIAIIIMIAIQLPAAPSVLGINHSACTPRPC